MRMLSMVCRNLYNKRPLKNGKTDAYAEHTRQDTRQFLMRMLSIHIKAGAYVKNFNNFLSTSKMKNFNKSLLTLINGLKRSTEKKIFWPKINKNLLKNRLSIRIRNFAPLNEPPNFFKQIFYFNPKSPLHRDFMV